MIASAVAQKSSGLKLPPSLPTRHPLGHLPEMARDPLGLFLRARAELGDVVRMRMAYRTVMAVYHPDHIRHVLVTSAAKYAKQTRGYRKLRLLLGNGLVTSEGDFWLRQRRIAQPAFHRQRIRGFADRMVAAADDLVREWAPVAAAGRPIDVAEAMFRLTLRIAGETLFSVDISRESDRVGH